MISPTTGIKKMFACLVVIASVLACKKDHLSSAGSSSSGAATRTLTQAIAVNPVTTLFAAALKRTHLDDSLLSAKGPYTVFAPCDSAFEKTGLNLQAINGMSLDSLRTIVRFHIAPGYHPSSNIPLYNFYVGHFSDVPMYTIDSGSLYLGRGLEYTSLSGLTARFPDAYFVNGIQADSTDEDCTNGVLFIMSGVLQASLRMDVLTYLSTAPQFSLYYYALQVTGSDQAVLTPRWYTPAGFTVFAPTNQAMISTGFMRDSATIDSAYAADQQNGTHLVGNTVSFPVSSGGILFRNGMLNSTYNSFANNGGYGSIGGSMRWQPWGAAVVLFTQTDPFQNLEVTAGFTTCCSPDVSAGSVMYSPGPPFTLLSDGIVYPTNVMLYID